MTTYEYLHEKRFHLGAHIILPEEGMPHYMEAFCLFPCTSENYDEVASRLRHGSVSLPANELPMKVREAMKRRSDTDLTYGGHWIRSVTRRSYYLHLYKFVGNRFAKLEIAYFDKDNLPMKNPLGQMRMMGQALSSILGSVPPLPVHLHKLDDTVLLMPEFIKKYS